MRLVLLHPEVPSCADCERWVYDPATWQRTERGGTPAPRPAGRQPPCYKCPKIPKGAEASPRVGRRHELNNATWPIYEHYLRCRAVGRFPADPIVERHAAILRQVEDLAEHNRALEPIVAIAKLLGGGRP